MAQTHAGRIANERDRQVASHLLDYLKDHPAEKALLFYGMDHLSTRPTRRSWAQRLYGAKETWQPLGHLLKQELGEGFLSVAQTPFPPSVRRPGSVHLSLTTDNIFLKAGNIPWKLTQIDPADYDGVIFLNAERIDEAHLLRYICSRRILEHAIERLAHIETVALGGPANPFAARVLEDK